MDVAELRRTRSSLNTFLKQFDDCFTRKDTRAHLPVYITGQLSDLPRKSVEPIAVEAGMAPRTLQEFLSQHRWDEDSARDRLESIVRDEHSGPRSIGVIDETSAVKKGDKTPGVQRQWCGAVGKTENCVVTVHLGYARHDFHCLLDGELYLPKSWADDPERREDAGIPEEMTYRPKWQIALELYDRAVGNGLRFDWITFDEWYGGKPGFLQGLSARGQLFVGEIPRNVFGWLKPPRVITRPYRRAGRGRRRKTPRLAGDARSAKRVDQLLNEPELAKQPWRRFRIKDTDKGPLIWDVKCVRFYPRGEDGLPGPPAYLIIASDVLNPEELKFFVSNAPVGTPVETMLLVGFSRWRVERCFEDQKGEIGLDHYEGRRYLGLKRHLILSSVSYLFLARMRQGLGGKKPGADRVSVAHGDCGDDPVLVAGPSRPGRGAGANRREDQPHAASKRHGTAKSLEKGQKATAQTRYQVVRNSPLLLGADLAL